MLEPIRFWPGLIFPACFRAHGTQSTTAIWPHPRYVRGGLGQHYHTEALTQRRSSRFKSRTRGRSTRGWFVKKSCTLHATSACSSQSCLYARPYHTSLHMTGCVWKQSAVDFMMCGPSTAETALSKSSSRWFWRRESRYTSHRARLATTSAGKLNTLMNCVRS